MTVQQAWKLADELARSESELERRLGLSILLAEIERLQIMLGERTPPPARRSPTWMKLVPTDGGES